MAAIVISLPITVSGQYIRVRSFDRYSYVLTKTFCNHGDPFDFNWFEDTYYHVADTSVSTEYDGSTYGLPPTPAHPNYYGPCYPKYVYTDVFWSPLGALGDVVHDEYDDYGNLVYYGEWETDPFDTTVFLPWRRCNRTIYTPMSQGAYSWTHVDHTAETVTIDLVTDGTPGVAAQRLWRLDVTAENSDTGQPIPPDQIMLLG